MKKNIGIIILTVTIMYLLWLFGLEKIYAWLLNLVINAILVVSVVRTEIQMESGHPAIYWFFNESGDMWWKEPLETIIFPMVILLSWQIFIFFHIHYKKSLRLFIRNFSVFFILQVIYLFTIYGFPFSETAKFIFRLLKNSFGIIVLFMILIDIIVLKINFKNRPGLVHKPDK